MENKEISVHNKLLLHINRLKAEKFELEDELEHTFKEFTYTLDPFFIAKKSLHKLVEDKEVQTDLVSVGLNLITNFFIERILGRQTVKGYLSSVLVEKISTSLINNNAAGIVSLISTLQTKNQTK